MGCPTASPGHCRLPSELPAATGVFSLALLPAVDSAALSAGGAGRRAAAPVEPSRRDTPWTAAADAGLAIGRGSQRAATGTASTFTKLGRKIAGAF